MASSSVIGPSPTYCDGSASSSASSGAVELECEFEFEAAAARAEEGGCRGANAEIEIFFVVPPRIDDARRTATTPRRATLVVAFLVARIGASDGVGARAVQIVVVVIAFCCSSPLPNLNQISIRVSRGLPSSASSSQTLRFFLFASTIFFISAFVGGFGPSGGYTTYAWRLMMVSRFSGFAANATVIAIGMERYVANLKSSRENLGRALDILRAVARAREARRRGSSVPGSSGGASAE
jgi:hypothetical protein